MPPKKDEKIVNLIKAFNAATTAQVISVDPSDRVVTIFWKEKTPYVKGGWRYGSVSFPVK